MNVSSLVAALHFVGAFGVAATVFCEWLTFNRSLTHAEARRIQRCDAWYGLSALAVVFAGLLRVYFFEKGSAFYLDNGVFLLKIGLFAAMGLLSIYPTVKFIRWRPATRANLAPVISEREYSRLVLILRTELLLLVGIVFAASFMAKGVGL